MNNEDKLKKFIVDNINANDLYNFIKHHISHSKLNKIPYPIKYNERDKLPNSIVATDENGGIIGLVFFPCSSELVSFISDLDAEEIYNKLVVYHKNLAFV